MTLDSINPATGHLIASFERMKGPAIDAALNASMRAFKQHRTRSVAERSEHLMSAARILTAERARLGHLLTEEMGKTLGSAHAEIDKCAWVCRYYAERAEEFLRDIVIDSDASKSYVAHLPLGPVLAVMPWNFPFWQVFRFAAPALMAGNSILLKHAANVPRAALALEDIFVRAGFEPGVFQTLLIDKASVEQLIADSRIQAATVTGSITAGSAVASIAGKHAKKTVLELGGSDAFIVMPSADIAAAVDAGVTSRTINNGQSCIAAKRFIVHRDIYDTFIERFVSRFESLRVGDPLDADTDIGPLAMERIRKRLDEQVESLVANGASRLCGAGMRDGPGYFYSPGVLSDIPLDAATYRQEIFGPVALVMKVESFDDALMIANNHPYGLGSSLWTQDSEEIERAVRELEAGTTFVNSFVRSDPRLPFGGIKASGYGRELSKLGILEFVNQKTVSIA